MIAMGGPRGPEARPLPSEVAARLGPYDVYLLVDPATDEAFYVGKGTGARLLAHGVAADLAAEAGASSRVARIRAVRVQGREPRLEVVRYGLTEQEALLVEAALIDCLPNLTNKVSGHGAAEGRMPLTELVVRYGAPPLTATDPPVLLIRLTPRPVSLDPPEELEAGYFRTRAGWYPGIPAADLLEATRGWWNVNPRSVERRGVHHVVAVVEGVTRGLYAVDSGSGRGGRMDGGRSLLASSRQGRYGRPMWVRSVAAYPSRRTRRTRSPISPPSAGSHRSGADRMWAASVQVQVVAPAPPAPPARCAQCVLRRLRARCPLGGVPPTRWSRWRPLFLGIPGAVGLLAPFLLLPSSGLVWILLLLPPLVSGHRPTPFRPPTAGSPRGPPPAALQSRGRRRLGRG